MKKIRRIRNDYRALPKGYYHFCTDGWKDGFIFNNEKQFVSGITSLALMTVKYDITIYAFSLMPNHIHILLSGTGSECLEAFFLLMRRCARRLREDGFAPLPDDYGFMLIPVDTAESFRSHLLYIARNPYEKGRCVPGGYRWGSDYLLYNDWADEFQGDKAETLSRAEIVMRTDCYATLPGDWEIHPRLGILARNFVKTDKVLQMFPTSKVYLTRMVKDYESFVHISGRLKEEFEISDTEIWDILFHQTSELFPGKSYKTLLPDEKIRLAVIVTDKFNIPAVRLSDLLRIPALTITQALSSKDYKVHRLTGFPAKSVTP